MQRIRSLPAFAKSLACEAKQLQASLLDSFQGTGPNSGIKRAGELGFTSEGKLQLDEYTHNAAQWWIGQQLVQNLFTQLVEVPAVVKESVFATDPCGVPTVEPGSRASSHELPTGSSSMAASAGDWQNTLDPQSVSATFPPSLSLQDQPELMRTFQGSEGLVQLAGFFELFLAEYDRSERRKKGAFYTPRPVVECMVRSVDQLLRVEFHRPHGLIEQVAIEKTDTGQLALGTASPGNSGGPALRILDPAAGTGAFLLAVIDQIQDSTTSIWRQTGYSASEVQELWNEYVPRLLVHQIGGYELSPATASIANLLLRVRLAQTGYDFRKPLPRIVHPFDPLAGTPPPEPENGSTDDRIPVVIGNPPFSALSENKSRWICDLLRGILPDGRKGADYYTLNGKALGEKKLWLQDDYVKFFRYAQWLVERRRAGIVALVANHGYLDNPTFRGMRQSLLEDFNRIHVLDLHGNRKKHELGMQGQPDGNVFPVEQGVALGLFCRTAERTTPAEINHGDLWGSRREKLATLKSATLQSLTSGPLFPASPYHFFCPVDDSRRQEYELGYGLTEVMPLYSSAVVTARDGFVVAMERDELIQRMRMFRNLKISDEEIRARFFKNTRSTKYPPGDTRGWKLAKARARAADDADWQQRILRCDYRPFDRRWIFWADWMLDWIRPQLAQHIVGRSNQMLIARRQMLRSQPCNFFWCSELPTLDGILRSDNRGNESVFPLYLYHDPPSRGQPPREANLSRKFVNDICQVLSLNWLPQDRGDLETTLGPEDCFHYIYALFFSTDYRQRFAEMLCTDFPRIFLPVNPALGRQLCLAGARLAGCHRLAEEQLPASRVTFAGDEQPVVQKGFPKFAGHQVRINENSCFQQVSRAVWNYRVGGHQVGYKWLKDRRGRSLTREDLQKYCRTLTAIETTITAVREIDQRIAAHGGWPAAFCGKEKTGSRMS
ncbi:MAG: hypothetical protein CMJ81_14110 [Planctomycetaceae bacterium]|nr:hypothetical protein [Planctomycetaceae bacterium]MBP61538.1 hypothetical protein [Planctomycetaceae bacterium]